ncbi:hypothetical protein F373_gp102 [Bacillus phage SP-10]|uniref:hypothetical protein n=1 Tax=Bacillus phage SP10 TaxID=941058 RepID=UPI0002198B3A|nr:hypothetical protein F373_gp102 [Bacillus phage SP-10]BAK52914.1 hypothetical protein [Bacillus phage SP-10]
MTVIIKNNVNGLTKEIENDIQTMMLAVDYFVCSLYTGGSFDEVNDFSIIDGGAERKLADDVDFVKEYKEYVKRLPERNIQTHSLRKLETQTNDLVTGFVKTVTFVSTTYLSDDEKKAVNSVLKNRLQDLQNYQQLKTEAVRRVTELNSKQSGLIQAIQYVGSNMSDSTFRDAVVDAVVAKFIEATKNQQ